MPIVEILKNKLDVRKSGNDCDFNGYLEDYLNEGITHDNVIVPALQAILQNNPQAKIVVNLKLPINQDAISNKLIRYKDSFKLQGKPITVPFILYGEHEDKERALIIVPFGPYSYLISKGIYYCMTEPGSEFVDVRNEVVEISPKTSEELIETYSNLYKMTSGAIQRTLDVKYFSNYDSVKADAVAYSIQLAENASDFLKDCEDRTPHIYEKIVMWFLLKKVLYVQYMMNKNLLHRIHGGNVKERRKHAKENSEEIKFISLRDLYHL